MLTSNDSVTAEPAPIASSSENMTSESANAGNSSNPLHQSRLERVLRMEWLGQTVASVCWIVSVLTYGISSSGDWLQLLAASSWLLANVAAAMSIEG